MNILPFSKDIQSIKQTKPIWTSVWTFDVAGRVFSVQVEHWEAQDAPRGAYPLGYEDGLGLTAKLIDWASGVSYGPRALIQESVSLGHERHPQGDPGA